MENEIKEDEQPLYKIHKFEDVKSCVNFIKKNNEENQRKTLQRAGIKYS